MSAIAAMVLLTSAMLALDPPVRAVEGSKPLPEPDEDDAQADQCGISPSSSPK